jgi:hypothetical protein
VVYRGAKLFLNITNTATIVYTRTRLLQQDTIHSNCGLCLGYTSTATYIKIHCTYTVDLMGYLHNNMPFKDIVKIYLYRFEGAYVRIHKNTQGSKYTKELCINLCYSE